MQQITLCHDAATPKQTATIDADKLPIELKSFFKWRKDVSYSRLIKCGTKQYDRFITHLKNKGY